MKLTTRLSALALVSALVLTGCGDDGDNDDKGATSGDPGQSETSTDGTDSTEAPTEDESEATAEGEPVDREEFLADYREGVEQLTTAQLDMDMEILGEKVTGTGEIDYTGSSPKMAMRLTGSQTMGGDVEMRLLDGVMYMKTSQSRGKFLKLDLARMAESMGMGDMLKSMDPVSAFDQYAEALTEVTHLGEDEHDGEELERYSMTVDTTRVEAFKKLPNRANIPKTITSEVWLDDENRLAGFSSDVPGAGPVQMWLTDFGGDVSIEAPPASQVTQMPGTRG